MGTTPWIQGSVEPLSLPNTQNPGPKARILDSRGFITFDPLDDFPADFLGCSPAGSGLEPDHPFALPLTPFGDR